MRIEHLQYLLAVVKYGSMSQAAKELYVSQPSISNAIKKMEQELGSQIIRRTHSGIEITPFGKMVIDDARLIVGCLDRWKVSAKQTSLYEPVKIRLTGGCPRYKLISTIMELQRNNPGLHIDIQYISSLEKDYAFSDLHLRITIIYRAQGDIAKTITMAKVYEQQVAVLEQDEFCLICNKDSDLAEKDEVKLEDLRGRRLLLFQNPMLFPYIKPLLEVNADVDQQLWLEENINAALVDDLQAASLRPRKSLLKNQYTESGLVVKRSITDLPMPIMPVMVYPADRRLTDSERMFVNAFLERFPDYEVVSKY